MKNLKDKFKKLNPKYAAYALFAVPAVILVLFVFLVHRPWGGKIKSLEEKVMQNKGEIAKSEVMERKLKDLKAANDRLQADFQNATHLLPPPTESDRLPDIISQMVKESNLTIKTVSPGKRVPGPGGIYEEMPINVEFNGTYHDAGRLLEKVDAITQLSTVSEVKMSSAKMEGTKMNIPVKLTVIAFSAGGGN